MVLFIIRRLVWAVLLVFVISLVTFVIFFLVPNNGATLRFGRGSLARSLQTQFSLPGSLPDQYASFLAHVFKGDFGRSTRTGDSASDVIKVSLPVTASLVIGGTIAFSPLFLAAPLNANGRSFGSFGVVLTTVGYAFVLLTMSLVCAVFSPVWVNWRQSERERRRSADVVADVATP